MLTTHSNFCKGVKNTKINFSYHTESISRKEDHFKPKQTFFWKKNSEKK